MINKNYDEVISRSQAFLSYSTLFREYKVTMDIGAHVVFENLSIELSLIIEGSYSNVCCKEIYNLFLWLTGKCFIRLVLCSIPIYEKIFFSLVGLIMPSKTAWL